MTSLNTLTGRNGKFVVAGSLVARTTRWGVKPTMATKSEWGDSDSAGFTNRAAGRKDCTFDTNGKFDTTDEIYDLFMPEDIAAVVLWMNATTLYWDFTRALCLDFSLEVNIETEEVIGWQSSWGADGEFYHPGEAGAGVHTLPAS